MSAIAIANAATAIAISVRGRDLRSMVLSAVQVVVAFCDFRCLTAVVAPPFNLARGDVAANIGGLLTQAEPDEHMSWHRP